MTVTALPLSLPIDSALAHKWAVHGVLIERGNGRNPLDAIGSRHVLVIALKDDGELRRVADHLELLWPGNTAHRQAGDL